MKKRYEKKINGKGRTYKKRIEKMKMRKIYFLWKMQRKNCSRWIPYLL
jgi:hypothetical protein